ncbi:hypothetical protein TNCV_4862711 [Trichonephila clavipes]|nr:hypothetical protein TNCV_4862711 [Trichonephila clavipes]
MQTVLIGGVPKILCHVPLMAHVLLWFAIPALGFKVHHLLYKVGLQGYQNSKLRLGNAFHDFATGYHGRVIVFGKSTMIRWLFICLIARKVKETNTRTVDDRFRISIFESRSAHELGAYRNYLMGFVITHLSQRQAFEEPRDLTKIIFLLGTRRAMQDAREMFSRVSYTFLLKGNFYIESVLPNGGKQRHFEICSKLKKYCCDADSDDGMDNAAPVPTTFQMRNVMKSMRSYLDAHSNGEMNNKLDDIEKFVA